uniref:ELFV_dehydrog domain-containing protein n=2 Tax=Caenorhabditis tropicalis TaxID=1561998 RepID=A0A1I7U814_9PELO
MPITHWETAPIPTTEKHKALKRVREMDEATIDSNTIPKSSSSTAPTKRKKDEKIQAEDPKSKRLEWLKERAKNAVIPVEESAIIRPDHIFGDCGPNGLIHIRHACRKFNSSRPSKLVAEGMMELHKIADNEGRFSAVNFDSSDILFSVKRLVLEKSESAGGTASISFAKLGVSAVPYLIVHFRGII